MWRILYAHISRIIWRALVLETVQSSIITGLRGRYLKCKILAHTIIQLNCNFKKQYFRRAGVILNTTWIVLQFFQIWNVWKMKGKLQCLLYCRRVNNSLDLYLCEILQTLFRTEFSIFKKTLRITIIEFAELNISGLNMT